jgi:hypothetical protein
MSEPLHPVTHDLPGAPGDPGYEEWEAWWLSLTPDEREAEIRSMDAHVSSSEAEPISERIEPGVEAARRDDLARDVAHWWRGGAAFRRDEVREGMPNLAAALDRLAVAYDFNSGSGSTT